MKPLIFVGGGGHCRSVINSLGKKESSIVEIDEGKVMAALNSYSRYVYKRVKKIAGRELMYDDLEVD